MALFKINKGKSNKLPATYKEGYCYFTTDDGKFYVDTTNSAAGRIALNALKADTLALGGYLNSEIRLGATISHGSQLWIKPGQNYLYSGYWYADGYERTTKWGTYWNCYWIEQTYSTSQILTSWIRYGWTRDTSEPSVSAEGSDGPVSTTYPITYTPNNKIQDIFQLKAPRQRIVNTTPENTTAQTYTYVLTYMSAPSSWSNGQFLCYKGDGEIGFSSASIGDASTPVYVQNGSFKQCTGISTVGLTHIGNDAPTSTNYVLWVDEDEETPATMPADAIKYKTFSIATSAWSGSGPYTYTMTANGITANSAIINLTLDATSQTYQKAQLDWETTTNQIILSTATKPTGTIAGYLIATDVTVI